MPRYGKVRIDEAACKADLPAAVNCMSNLEKPMEKRFIQKSLCKFMSVLASLWGAIQLTHSQEYQAPTTVDLTSTKIPCKMGIFSGYNANYHINDVDMLTIQAIVAGRKFGNGIRFSICNDAGFDTIDSKYKSMIITRVDVANACVTKQYSELQAGGFQAALANVKLENDVLRTIQELLAFAEGRERLAEDAGKAAEITNGLVGAKANVKELMDLAGMVKVGDGMAGHLATQVIEDKVFDKIKAVLLAPRIIGEDVEKMYLDVAYGGRLSEIRSFSYSECK